MSSRHVATVYYENWLLKKEGVKTWISYWTVIRGKWLQFYERKSDKDKPELRKTLELPTKTQCSLVKRKKKRFPFSINNGMGTYYMKCETEIERYHWIFSILTAALGRPKKDLPATIPESMVENEAFKKLAKGEHKTDQENVSPAKSTSSSMSTSPNKKTSTKRPTSSSDNMYSKRRQKYAMRNEIRAKRKAAKRAKKLGLPIEDENPSGETSEQKLRKMKGNDAVNTLEKSIDTLKRTKNVKFGDGPNVRRPESLDFADEKVKESKASASVPDLTKNIELDFKIRSTNTSKSRSHSGTAEGRLRSRAPSDWANEDTPNEPGSSVQVKVMMNPKQRSSISSDIGDSNFAYEVDDGVEVYPHLPVMLDDEQLLPNMIVTEISDSESEGTENTVETSINSDTNSFLSLSASRTFISAHDDDEYEQHDRRGSVISSSALSPYHNSVLNNRTNTRPVSPYNRPVSPGNRPVSPGLHLNTKQKNLLDRPITPSYEKPLSPNRTPAHFSRFLVGSTNA